MKLIPKKNVSGFTLIETLIYIALFSLMSVGGFSTLAVLQESGQRSQSEAIAIEKAAFIGDKIQNAIESGDQFPVSGEFSDSTTISYVQNRFDDDPAHIIFSFSIPVSSSQVPITITRTTYLTP